MTQWLVTGATGFIGGAVVNAIEARGGVVIALGRDGPRDARPSVRADLEQLTPDELARALSTFSFDHVVHCAGRTTPAPLESLWRGNVRGAACLLEALSKMKRRVRVVLTGSAAELGPVPSHHLPASESCPCRPSNAYGLSKWAATRLGLAHSGASNVEVVVGRVFNPIGPRLPAGQAFGRFARTLAVDSGEPVVLRAGNLDVRRDFIDVRDVADALIALAERATAGAVYHIGTGVSLSLGEGLSLLIRASGRNAVVAQDAPRPRGPDDSRADIARIQNETGWVPRLCFEQSIGDLWKWVAAQTHLDAPTRSLDPAA